MSARQHEPLRLALPGGEELCGALSFAGRVGPGLVLYVHGFGSHHAGNKSQALEADCARRGWPFAAFDFRGHGRSGGTMLQLRGRGLQDDLDCAWEHLRRRGARRLFLTGSSMGGWAGAWFATRRPQEVAALVAIAPAFDFLGRHWAALDEGEQRAWRETGRRRVQNQWLDVELGYGLAEERDAFRVEDLAARWATPLLIFHGLRDNAVPWRESVDFAAACAFPDVEVRLFKDGDHRLLALADEMAEEACRFFQRHGAPAG
jgi:alpha-beta hydrolase superfamily lysophospholipase